MSSPVNPFQDPRAGLPADVELISGPDFPARERRQAPLKPATRHGVQEDARHGWLRFLPNFRNIPKPWVTVVSVALLGCLLSCVGYHSCLDGHATVNDVAVPKNRVRSELVDPCQSYLQLAATCESDAGKASALDEAAPDIAC